MKFKQFIAVIVVWGSLFSLAANASANEEIVDGLKEALRVGVTEAVKIVGVENGYFKNLNIRIPVPEKLKKADETIRAFGGAAISDMLVEKMNRAAEQAAPQAKEIFFNAIREIRFDDAMKIYSGDNHAATAYLEEHASEKLKAAFYPIVKSTMHELGVLKAFDDYVGKLDADAVGQVGAFLTALPLTKSGPLAEYADIDLDINGYVTDKAIDGLFKTVAIQEEKIRENPKARVTDLLKDLFGAFVKQ